MASNGALHRISKSVESCIASGFKTLGRLVANWPCTTIFLSLGLTVVLGVLGFAQFEQEWSAYDLYVPKGASSAIDREIVEETFGYFPLMGKILVFSKNGSDVNLLEQPKQNLLEMMSIWDKIRGKTLGVPFSDFEAICERPKSGLPCKVTSILHFWDYNRTKLVMDRDPLKTINTVELTDSYGNHVDLKVVLGGIERDSNDKVIGANAFSTYYSFETNIDRQERQVFGLWKKQMLAEGRNQAEWEAAQKYLDQGFSPRPYALDKKIARDMKNWEFKGRHQLRVSMTHNALIQDESDKNIVKDFVWIGLALALVALFGHIAFFRNNCTYCKMHLVSIAGISIAMALVAGCGCAALAGKEFNIVVLAVPFLIIGLGMDDAFIIVGQLKRTDPSLSPSERLSTAMGRAGPSILVTSLTDLVAFLLSLTSSLPALDAFGVYASFGVFFDFLFQVTFFAAFVAFEARREYQSLRKLRQHEMTHSTSSPTDNSENANSYSIQKSSTQEIHRDAERGHLVEAPRIFGSGPFDPNAPSLSTKMFGVWIPSLTLTKLGSIFVLSLELLGLIVAIYGCTRATVDFQFKDWFTAKDSWIREGFRIENKHFFGSQDYVTLYSRQGDYFHNQKNLLKCAQSIQTSPHLSEFPHPRSWYLEYVKWSRKVYPGQLIDGWAPDSDSFIRLVKEFLSTEAGEFYIGDVKFSENEIDVYSTILITGYSKNIGKSLQGVDMMNDLKSRAMENIPELKPVLISSLFPFYEGLEVVEKDVMKNLLLVAIAVLIIVGFMLVNIMASLLVVIVVVLTDIYLIGSMWLMDLSFNMVTEICIVLAVGIAVDYSVHIAHSFLIQKGTNKERVLGSLQNIGGEVFCGAATSFLAIMGLAFTTTHVMQVFFKMLSTLIVLGAWHGLIILPILLAKFGPSLHRE